MVRVLVVYGTETGTAKGAVVKMAKSLAKQSGDIEIVDTLEGNSVPALATLSEKYDMLLVATSSFGEGDPPSNFAALLLALTKGAKAGDKPLAGLQHVRARKE